jgi:hypothetical protein
MRHLQEKGQDCTIPCTSIGVLAVAGNRAGGIRTTINDPDDHFSHCSLLSSVLPEFRNRELSIGSLLVFRAPKCLDRGTLTVAPEPMK